MLDLNILFQDEFLLVVDKPALSFVHAPDIRGVKVDRNRVLLNLLRKQLGKFVYPIHRLDFATSGCVVFALNSEIASKMGRDMMTGTWKKTYHAVLRGWLKENFTWEQDLKSQKDSSKMLSALSIGRSLSQIELDPLPGSKFAHSRYTLAEINLETGRYHQIRRHANFYSHPVIGDVSHGDRHHNRYFRERLDVEGLCLRARSLEFLHPISQEPLTIVAPVVKPWDKLYKLFGKTILR